MRVLNEEHRGVIAHQIENTLFGIKLGGKAADIPDGICRTRAALYGGEAHKYRSDFVRIGEEIRFGDRFQALIGLEVAVRSGTARVDDAFRYPLVVEMGDFFPQDKIFQQGWPARACAKGVLIVSNAHALIGGERKTFAAFAVWLKRFQLIVSRLRRFHASRCGRLFARCRGARGGAVRAVSRGERVHTRLRFLSAMNR